MLITGDLHLTEWPKQQHAQEKCDLQPAGNEESAVNSNDSTDHAYNDDVLKQYNYLVALNTIILIQDSVIYL